MHPVGLLDELAALHLEDLHPAAALMVLGGDLEWRDEAAEGEIADRSRPFLMSSPVGGLPPLAFSASDRLDMDRRLEQTAVVIDGVLVHPLGAPCRPSCTSP